MIRSARILTLLAAVLTAPCGAVTRDDELFDKMEADVIELATQVEQAYNNRCFSALSNCQQMNYDECSSEYPSLDCPNTELAVELCGGESCSSLIDPTVSAVSLPREIARGTNGNPTDEQVIESVCYTRELDGWFQEKRSSDQDFWRNEYNVEPPQMFVGSQDGTFRIHPARHANTCGDFDPRTRPWYVAGSSGPKNIILVLDTSGSMQGIRLDLMKQAAIRVVETLTISDRVGIVHFSSQATVVTTQMVIATVDNKQDLVSKINALEARGATNFFDAFTNAFKMVDETTESELHVDCNSAILFLTDGLMTDPDNKTEDDVIELVTSELGQVQQDLGKPVFLFTYSISDSSDVHEFPKRLACSSELGVFSQILDESEIVQSLTSYYRLFALGLGTDRNTNFVAWAEPFNFYPSGVLGTTASAPVYDRTKEPPQFIGVVGMAFTLSAIDQALGVESMSQATLDRVIRQSTAKCPSINLTLCELESYRGEGGRCAAANNSATVDSCDFIQIEASKCPGTHDYPQDLWANNNFLDWEFEERSCCKIGENAPSDECDAASSSALSISPAALIGGIGAMIVGLAGVVAVALWYKRRQQTKATATEPKDRPAQAERLPPPTAPMEQPLEDVEIMRPPPSAFTK